MKKKNGTDLAHLQMASGLENHENIGMYQHFISLTILVARLHSSLSNVGVNE